MEAFLHKKDMPKSCFGCPLADYSSDFPNVYCNATYELINDGEQDITEERHSTCPLKPINESELTPKYKGVENG